MVTSEIVRSCDGLKLSVRVNSLKRDNNISKSESVKGRR